MIDFNSDNQFRNKYALLGNDDIASIVAESNQDSDCNLRDDNSNANTKDNTINQQPSQSMTANANITLKRSKTDIKRACRLYMSRAGWVKVMEIMDGMYGPKEIRPMLETIMAYAYGKPKNQDEEKTDTTLQVVLNVQSQQGLQVNVNDDRNK